MLKKQPKYIDTHALLSSITIKNQICHFKIPSNTIDFFYILISNISALLNEIYIRKNDKLTLYIYNNENKLVAFNFSRKKLSYKEVEDIELENHLQYYFKKHKALFKNDNFDTKKQAFQTFFYLDTIVLGVFAYEQRHFYKRNLNLLITFNKFLVKDVFNIMHSNRVDSLDIIIKLIITNTKIIYYGSRVSLLNLEMLNIFKSIHQKTNLKKILSLIIDTSKKVLHTERASLLLLDDTKQNMIFHIVTKKIDYKKIKKITVPVQGSIAGKVVLTQKSMLINDVSKEKFFFEDVDDKLNYKTYNLMATPIFFKKKIIGVIEVVNSLGRLEFTQEDLFIFESLAEQIILAIQNQKTIDHSKMTNKSLATALGELSLINAVKDAMNHAHHLQSMLKNVVLSIAKEIKSKVVSIVLWNFEEHRLELVAYTGINHTIRPDYEIKQNAPSYNVFLKKEPLFITSKNFIKKFKKENSIHYETQSLIIYPLISGETCYGVLNLTDKINKKNFNQVELKVISIIANQVANKIQSLLMQQKMLEAKHMEKEIHIASDVQKSILLHKKPNINDLDLYFFYKSALVISGDLYDYFFKTNENLEILIGDVSGKSVPAAMFMATTHAIIRTLNVRNLSLSELLRDVNEILCQRNMKLMFVTMFYMNYHIQSKKLTYSSAGHNNQLLLRGKTKQFEYLKTRGCPLGIIKQVDPEYIMYEEKYTFLETGDILVLYTDGIIEAINSKEEEYGMEQFKKIILENYHLSSQRMTLRIYKDIRRFSKQVKQFDDMTLFVIKVK